MERPALGIAFPPPPRPLGLFPLKMSELRGHSAPLKAESPGFCDTGECLLLSRSEPGAPRARGKGNPRPWVGRRGRPGRAPHKGALFPNQRA